MKRLPSLNALRAFAAAAHEGSFTLAGEALHVTQGAISRQVKQLESDLGVALFLRKHQKVELTVAGRALAATLNRLFQEMELAVQQAAMGTQRQMLKLNAPPTFATRWLAPRLSDFRAQFPQIDLSITTDRVQSVREARGLDCLIVFGQEAWTQATCESVMQERHILASSPKLWVQGAPPALAHSTLLHVLDGDQRIPVWEQWIARHGPPELDAQPGLNFSTLDQAINAAIAGAGVVVVDAAMIVRELQSGALVRHNDLEVAGPHGYWFLATPARTPAAAPVQQFKHWLMEQVRQAHGANQPTPDSP
jgi:DNA-binding transcriptional LysR family regulator